MNLQKIKQATNQIKEDYPNDGEQFDDRIWAMGHDLSIISDAIHSLAQIVEAQQARIEELENSQL